MANDNIIYQIDRLIDEGHIEEAVRLSADALAEADARWTSARNNGQPTCTHLLEGSIIGSRHVESLILAGHIKEAFATSLLLLMKDAFDGSATNGLEESRLELLFFAMKSLTALASHVSPDDDEQVSLHVSAIISQLASMLYQTYRNLTEQGSEIPYLKPAFDMLKELRDIGAIQYPAVNIHGHNIPLENRMEILSDTIGRSRAIGWFNCD